MSYSVRLKESARKTLLRMDRPVQRRIGKFIDRFEAAADPRSLGEALAGALAGYWKYRVGDHRLIAQIEDRRLIVIIIKIGNWREVYR